MPIHGNPTGQDFGDLTQEQMRSAQPDYSKLDLYEQEYYKLVRRAEECVNDALGHAESFTEEMEARAQGCWVSILGRAETLLSKFEDKATDYAIARMSEAYSKALSLGIRVPQTEELLVSYGDPLPPIIDPGNPQRDCHDPATELDCVDSRTGKHIAVPKPVIDDKGNIAWPLVCTFCDTNEQAACPSGCLDALFGPNRPDRINEAGMITTGPTNQFPVDMYSWPTYPPGNWMQVGTGFVPIATLQSSGYTPVPYQIYGQPGYPNQGELGSSPIGPSGMGSGPGGTTGGGSCPPPCPPILNTADMVSSLKKNPPLPVTIVTTETTPTVPNIPFGKEPAAPPDFGAVIRATNPDWCSRFIQLRTDLIAIGNGILGKMDFAFDSLFQYIGYGASLPASTMNEWLKDAVQIYQNFQAGHVMTPYKEALNYYGTCDPTEATALLTLKRFFEWIESITLSGHKGLENDSKGELGTPPWMDFLLPISWHTEAIGSAGLDTHAEFKAFVVPAQELVELCIKYGCPSELPSIQDAIEEYLRGQITEEHCKCLVKVHGGAWGEFQNLIQARREQLIGDEIIRLWLRGQLDDKQVKERLRNAGFLRDTEVDEKLKLAQELPNISDLVRFMTRNIYNEEVLQRFNLDAEIDRAGMKPGQQLWQWWKSQGVPDEAIQAFWRAHWTVPSREQMNEMVQRLRPGRVSPDLEVTQKDYDQVLRENDWLEYWRPRMLALAYHPLTRIDVRRAYLNGLITRDDFKERTKDIGYDETNAEILAQFMDHERKKALENHKSVKLYEKNGINTAQVKDVLRSEGFTETEILTALSEVDSFKAAENQSKCVDEIGKKYKSGAMDQADANALLLSFNLDQAQIDRLFSLWNCAKRSTEKHETASILCDWFTNGLITADDFAGRLTTIGYNSRDVALIISRCNIRLSEKQAKEAEKAQKKAEAAKRKAEQLAKQRAKMEDDLVQAAGKFAKLNKSNEDDEAKAIQLAMDSIQQNYGIGWDVAYRAVMDSLAALPKEGPVDSYQFITAAVAAMRDIVTPWDQFQQLQGPQ